MANNDNIVKQLQEKIEEKRANLLRGSNNYRTNMQFKFSPDGKVQSLQIVNDKRLLVEMLAHIDLLREYYDNAAKYFNFTEPFKYLGYEYSDWLNDIESKFNNIKFQEDTASLKQLENRLAALESEDLKAEKELNAIMALLEKY